MAEGGKVWSRGGGNPHPACGHLPPAWADDGPPVGGVGVERGEGLAPRWCRNPQPGRLRTRVAESRTDFFTNHLTGLGSNAKVLEGLGKGVGERAGAGGRLPG